MFSDKYLLITHHLIFFGGIDFSANKVKLVDFKLWTQSCKIIYYTPYIFFKKNLMQQKGALLDFFYFEKKWRLLRLKIEMGRGALIK